MSALQPQKSREVGVEVHIEIEDYTELSSAKQVGLNVTPDVTIAQLLQKVAKKGNVSLISSDVSFGTNNFDLVRETETSTSVLDKTRTLADLGFKEKDRIDLKLRKKKRQQLAVKVIIDNYEELKGARQVGFRFLEDTLVSEAIHIIARKERVNIPSEDEGNYALYEEKTLLDFNSSIGSFNFKDRVELTLKRDPDRHFGVLIENYASLGSVRWTVGRFPRSTQVGEALLRIATKGSVGIPKDQVESYEFFNPHTNSSLDKSSSLSKLRNGDTLILRKTTTEVFGAINADELENMEKIGSGTFGKVFKAILRGREVAVKQLKEKPDPKLLEEFNREVNILKAASRCPQIVVLLGTVEDPKKMSIVMEYCSLGSLFHVMQNPAHSFGWERVFHCCIETIKGINFLHSEGILHRDIKSLNILVTKSWAVKLCDFGVARLSDNAVTLRKMRTTPAWSAPELLKEQPFSEKSDMYSMGIVLWECVNRSMKGSYQRPFSEFKGIHFDYQIIVQASSQNLRPSLPKTTPPSLLSLFQKLVSAEPNQRPSGQETLHELQNLKTEFENHLHDWNQLNKRQSTDHVPVDRGFSGELPDHV